MNCQHKRIRIDQRDPSEAFCWDCFHTVTLLTPLQIPPKREARLQGKAVLSAVKQ